MGHFISVARAGVMADAPPLAQVFLKAFLALVETAGVVMVIAMVVSGIFVMMVSGDRKRAEKSKKAFLYSIVGSVVVLGCYVLVRFLAQVVNATL